MDDRVDHERLNAKVGECLATFYEMMNAKAITLSMAKSHFAVAHGMHNDNNFSSALDIGKLSCYAMDNDYFRDVVI